MRRIWRRFTGKQAYRPGVVGRWFYVALAEANMFERGPLGLRLVGG